MSGTRPNGDERETGVGQGPRGDELGAGSDRQRAAARREAEDEILSAALASGLPYWAAGELAGVSRRTVARRMLDPDFVHGVASRRAEWVSVVTGQLMAAGPDAVRALRAGMMLGSPQLARQSAVDLLRLGLQYRDQVDVEAEVAELRRRLDDSDGL